MFPDLPGCRIAAQCDVGAAWQHARSEKTIVAYRAGHTQLVLAVFSPDDRMLASDHCHADNLAPALRATVAAVESAAV